MDDPRAALAATGSDSAAAPRRTCGRCSPRTPRPSSAPRASDAARGATRRCSSIARPRRSSSRAGAAPRRGPPLHGGLRGARRGRLRRWRRARGHRPDRRLAQRQARPPGPRPLDRRRRRARRWPTSPFGYVFDFGAARGVAPPAAARGPTWAASGCPACPSAARPDGRLELVAIESADPRWVAVAIEPLGLVAHRLRALGTIAVSICQVAAARVDGLVTLVRRCGRSTSRRPS